MSYDATKIILICQGTFDTSHKGTLEQDQKEKLLAIAGEIAASGFGTVVLGQWHVHADGSVYYNSSKYYPEGTSAPPGALDFNWILTEIPRALKAGGSVTNVMLEFGGWGCNDMAHMYTAEAAFRKTMTEIFTKYPNIDGLDFDVEGEEHYNSDSAQGTVNTAKWASSLGKTTTCIPYTAQDWWVDSVLKPTVTDEKTTFNWWNLQGASAQSYYDWVGYVSPLISNAGGFITFGFNFDGQGGGVQSPAAVQRTLAQAVGKYPALNGALIWRLEDILKSKYSVAEFGAALQAGLNGQSSEGSTS